MSDPLFHHTITVEVLDITIMQSLIQQHGSLEAVSIALDIRVDCIRHQYGLY